MSQVEAGIVADDRAAENAGVGAPRVTYEEMKARIRGEYYFSAHDGASAFARAAGLSFSPLSADVEPLSLLTICVLVIDNGFTITGESACASPENFNPVFGQELARKDAINKLWAFEGYLLREDLANRAALASLA